MGAPEIAFAGRSNVGKSTLINALTGRKALARTSHTPGRTQQLNFFDIDQGLYWLVDMPGYGYAKVSKKMRKDWDRLIFGYLQQRVTLRTVFLLIDMRHGLKDSDHHVMDLLTKAAVSTRVILTKQDKVKAEEREKTIETIRADLKKCPVAYPEPLVVSAHKGTGIEDLRNVITTLL